MIQGSSRSWCASTSRRSMLFLALLSFVFSASLLVPSSLGAEQDPYPYYQQQQQQQTSSSKQEASSSSNNRAYKGATGGRLGTLYDLRSKLARSSYIPENVKSSAKKKGNKTPEKEARGYAVHYNPSELSSSRHTDGRKEKLGKVETDVHNKKSYGQKHKVASSSYKKESQINSFTITEPSVVVALESSTKKHSKAASASSVVASAMLKHQQQQGVPNNNLLLGGMGALLPHLDMSRMATLGLGLNDAMTTALTNKLMAVVDADFPSHMLIPLKHLVASGNKMVELWDRRSSSSLAREGKPPLGVVEMFGAGIDQLKRYRDGQSIKLGDPIVNVTSPSKALIQGLLTVKKLTARVLGRDDENGLLGMESRGGGYGDGGGYGGGLSGGLGGLDPFALLAALAFGAFLLQVLLTLYYTSARSLDVVDLNTPLFLSDTHYDPTYMTQMDKIFGTPITRTKRSTDEDVEHPAFNSIIDQLDGLYRTYKVVSRSPKCARVYLCRMAVEDVDRDEEDRTIPAKLYLYGLKQAMRSDDGKKDESSEEFVKRIQIRVAQGEQVDCSKEVNDKDSGVCAESRADFDDLET